MSATSPLQKAQQGASCTAQVVLRTTSTGHEEFYRVTCELAAQFLKTVGNVMSYQKQGQSVGLEYTVQSLKLSQEKANVYVTEMPQAPTKAAATIDLFMQAGVNGMPLDLSKLNKNQVNKGSL